MAVGSIVKVRERGLHDNGNKINPLSPSKNMTSALTLIGDETRAVRSYMFAKKGGGDVGGASGNLSGKLKTKRGKGNLREIAIRPSLGCLVGEMK